MNYIIFDLEFNQGFDRLNNKTVSNAKCPFEIIQIGAIKLDSELNILDTFSSYIKSEIYKDIHPFVKKMTGITNSNLKNAPSFKEVYEDFLKFIGIKNSIFGTWGTNDLKELTNTPPALTNSRIRAIFSSAILYKTGVTSILYFTIFLSFKAWISKISHSIFISYRLSYIQRTTSL